MAGILRVKNWAKFQHYAHRKPPWIRLQADTFQDHDFSALPSASKLLAICIWTLASRSSDGTVTDDFAYIRHWGHLGTDVRKRHLEALIDHGFLIRASNSLASCKQNGGTETETETEAEHASTIRPSSSDYEGAVMEKRDLNATACAQKYCNEFSIIGWPKRDDVRAAIQLEHDQHPEISCEVITDLMVKARYKFLEIPPSERAFDWPAGAFLNESRWKQGTKWRKPNGEQSVSERILKRIREDDN